MDAGGAPEDAGAADAGAAVTLGNDAGGAVADATAAGAPYSDAGAEAPDRDAAGMEAADSSSGTPAATVSLGDSGEAAGGGPSSSGGCRVGDPIARQPGDATWFAFAGLLIVLRRQRRVRHPMA
jgi:hypothetical protein